MTATFTLAGQAAVSHGFCAYHRLPLACATIEIADAPVASGGFAGIYPVVAIDGAAAPTRLVAKVFDPDVLASAGGAGEIITRLDELIAALESRGGGAWPQELLAFPFLTGAATVDGRATAISLMLDLRALGYSPAPFRDLAEIARYRATHIRDRIELAGRFARRAETLESVGFVHADLNPENLLLHPGHLDVQIIDFDSGVLASSGRLPLAAGKADDCLPPETHEPTRTPPVAIERLTAEAERWATASILGYLCFGAHPAFFLRSISATTVAAYANTTPGWPEIDVRTDLFTTIPQNHRAYLRLRRELRHLPAPATALFRSFFQAGLNAAARPTAADWAAAFRLAKTPPVFETLTVEPAIVVEGDPVTISWTSSNAHEVTINNGPALPPAGHTVLTPSSHTVVTLTARNHFGETTERRDVPVLALDRLSIRLPRALPLADLAVITPRVRLALTRPRLTSRFYARRAPRT